jgi:hypothetical protein
MIEAMKQALEALEWNLVVIEDYGYKEQLSRQHKAIVALLQAIAEAEKQEPVAWASENVIPLRPCKDNHPCILTGFKCEANTIPLYTHPPKREPLTDEQIATISVECATVSPSDIYFARAIEAAHGIKGEA